jgi:co-chaperonin GroES (HSP10)
MKSVGKTYLIQVEMPTEEIVEGGIILPQTTSNDQLIHYIGTVIDYGLGFTEEEKKDLVPIGTRVIVDWKTKDAIGKIKLKLGQNTYYIYDPKYVIAMFVEEGE